MDMELIVKLNKDLKEAVKVLSPNEIRYLVDMYYAVQDYRKALASQTREQEPNALMTFLFEQIHMIEKNINKALNVWTDHNRMGQWLKDITGIGPVISAGLLAHIDIEKAPTVGHIWSFAGLNPLAKWNKGEKRPWNAKLKVLTWKISDSFVKTSNHPKSVYGPLYQQRKKREIEKNDKLEFKSQAEEILKTKRIGKDTEAYKYYSQGKLPPAHIDARARRYAVKQFLSDLHGEWYRYHFKTEPPKPYPIAILGHAHMR